MSAPRTVKTPKGKTSTQNGFGKTNGKTKGKRNANREADRDEAEHAHTNGRAETETESDASASDNDIENALELDVGDIVELDSEQTEGGPLSDEQMHTQLAALLQVCFVFVCDWHVP